MLHFLFENLGWVIIIVTLLILFFGWPGEAVPGMKSTRGIPVPHNYPPIGTLGNVKRLTGCNGPPPPPAPRSSQTDYTFGGKYELQEDGIHYRAKSVSGRVHKTNDFTERNACGYCTVYKKSCVCDLKEPVFQPVCCQVRCGGDCHGSC